MLSTMTYTAQGVSHYCCSLQHSNNFNSFPIAWKLINLIWNLLAIYFGHWISIIGNTNEKYNWFTYHFDIQWQIYLFFSQMVQHCCQKERHDKFQQVETIFINNALPTKPTYYTKISYKEMHILWISSVNSSSL